MKVKEVKIGDTINHFERIQTQEHGHATTYYKERKGIVIKIQFGRALLEFEDGERKWARIR